MNKVMNVIANKIIDLLRGRPALKVGEVSVWGDFSHDEKERLRLILLDGRNAREKEKEMEERLAELEAIRADTAQVFKEIGNELGCNPDNESIMMAIDELKKRLATPVRLSCETHPRCRTQHAKDIRAAGFTVTVESDEEPCHEKA